MPHEFRTIFRLVREGHISDKEAFQLLWMAFVAMTGYRQQENENCPPEASIEVKGFAR